jgi:hypothetical protein
MRKRYSVAIILIVLAVILNCIVMGILVPQQDAQNKRYIAYLDIPVSKVIVSVIPTNLLPSVASTPSPSLNTGKLTITSKQTNFTERSFLLTIFNDNTSQAIITDVLVNECPANLEKNIVIPANSNIALLLTLPDGITFARTYKIELLSSEGQSASFYIVAW